ncbi:MAG TPA: hypothetical protein VE053_06840 [Allosphingosinicella sp.]|nr:hypothetical protein [Allosphingosinicella sp.]
MPRKNELVAFVDTKPDFREIGGRVFYSPVGGGEEDLRCMPIAIFRQWIEAGQKLLDDWDARAAAGPIPIKEAVKRKR